MANQRNTDIELYETIKELFSQTDWPFAAIDIGITLSKMSDKQLNDLATMIKDMQQNPNTKIEYILGNVCHDLNGLKEGFLGVPGADCFSPRSHGYAKKAH